MFNLSYFAILCSPYMRMRPFWRRLDRNRVIVSILGILIKYNLQIVVVLFGNLGMVFFANLCKIPSVLSSHHLIVEVYRSSYMIFIVVH